MLVKHEFSAKTDARERERNNFIACARYVVLKKKTELLPFVPLLKSLFNSN
jgi:hypothetical protein